MSVNVVMLNKIKLMSWLDCIKEAIARFQEFIHILSHLSQIVPFKSIFNLTSIDRGKSNLHTLELRILYL